VFAGDSGYPLEPWLLTPVSTTTSPSEIAYNSAHSKTRVVIERCFGLWKSRFRCLDRSGGTLLYKAEKACQLVTATAVLHNFCVSRRIQSDVDAGVVQRSAAIQPATAADAHSQLQQQQQQSVGPSAIQLRRSVIQQF